MRRAALVVFVVACSSEPSAPCSVDDVTGDVPGITLAIHSSSCVYAVGEPATFTYDVTVDASVPALHYPAETTTCTARPHPYTTDPTSLVHSTVYGADHLYCWDCNFECSPGEGAVTLQLEPATTTHELVWPGTAGAPNADGAVFEPGAYAVRVVLDGGDAGFVAAELPITIVAAAH